MTDPFDLQRFVDAQAPVYQPVVAELRNGLRSELLPRHRSSRRNLRLSRRQVAELVKKACAVLTTSQKIAAETSQMRSTIFIDQPSDAPMCKMWMQPMVTNLNQIGRP